MGRAYLLNGHDDLDGIEAIEPEVVREVSRGLDLSNLSTPPFKHPQKPLPSVGRLTFAGSLT